MNSHQKATKHKHPQSGTLEMAQNQPINKYIAHIQYTCKFTEIVYWIKQEKIYENTENPFLSASGLTIREITLNYRSLPLKWVNQIKTKFLAVMERWSNYCKCMQTHGI